MEKKTPVELPTSEYFFQLSGKWELRISNSIIPPHGNLIKSFEKMLFMS